MIHVYDCASLPVSRWRNGGGETREIISFPPGKADFDWRASIATLARDGDFSLFPGIDRIITLLDGDGVALYGDGQLRQQLQPNQPFAFTGEEPIAARLLAGPSRDFNLMSRRESHSASAGVTRKPFSPLPACAGVVYVLEGEWQHPQARLAAGQGAWWEGDEGSFTPQSPDALLLWGSIAAISHAP